MGKMSIHRNPLYSAGIIDRLVLQLSTHGKITLIPDNGSMYSLMELRARSFSLSIDFTQA